MAGIIRIRNAAYDRYEELLLRRNDLRKECFQLEREYTRVFGEDIMAVFRMKIECAKKIKAIEFCQRMVNRGDEPDEKELQAFIAQETQALEEHLENMVDDYENARNTGAVTDAELMEIKQTYRIIVKELHPDVNPQVAESEKLQELWNQVAVAYNCNDLPALKELEVLVTAAVNEMAAGDLEIEIPDIEEKIAGLEKEIQEIMSTDPWQLQFLLNDKEKVEMKKQSLREELKNYQEYSRKLDAILENVLPEGTVIVWGLN